MRVLCLLLFFLFSVYFISKPTYANGGDTEQRSASVTPGEDEPQQDALPPPDIEGIRNLLDHIMSSAGAVESFSDGFKGRTSNIKNSLGAVLQATNELSADLAALLAADAAKACGDDPAGPPGAQNLSASDRRRIFAQNCLQSAKEHFAGAVSKFTELKAELDRLTAFMNTLSGEDQTTGSIPPPPPPPPRRTELILHKVLAGDLRYYKAYCDATEHAKVLCFGQPRILSTDETNGTEYVREPAIKFDFKHTITYCDFIDKKNPIESIPSMSTKLCGFNPSPQGKRRVFVKYSCQEGGTQFKKYFRDRAKIILNCNSQ